MPARGENMQLQEGGTSGCQNLGTEISGEFVRSKLINLEKEKKKWDLGGSASLWFDLTAEGIDAEKDAFLHASCWKKKERKKKRGTRRNREQW